MKFRILLLTALCCAPFLKMNAGSNDSLGLPGDNLDLCGVLELFKKAKSPEDFEKALNAKDNKINNLDLNQDGKVDYIRVIDNQTDKNNAHAIILRDPVNEKESQDVAVIEIEKTGEKSAKLQIIGDEELYGKNYIIEPKSGDKTEKGKGFGQGFKSQVFIVDVWYWPCVQYIWYPGYVVWVSPWYWSYYPAWWYPWPPYPYVVYYDYVYIYHDDYYWTDEYRCHDANTYYGPRRETSGTVHRTYVANHEQVKATQRANGQQPVPAAPSRRTTPSGPRTAPREAGQDKKVPNERTQPQPQPQKRETPPAPQPNERKPEGTPPPQERKPDNVTPPAPQPVPTPQPREVPNERPTPTPRTVPTPPAPRPSPAPAPRPMPAPSPRPMPVPHNPRPR